MSFILDALKKSEHERQRQSVPGLVQSGFVRPRQHLPPWALGLYVLVGITLLVLLFVLIRGWLLPPPGAPTVASPQGTVTPDATTPRRAASGSVAPARPFSPLDAAPIYAPEIPVDSPDVPATAQARSPTTRSALREPASRAPASAGPRLNDGDYKTNEEEVLPSINELNLTGAQALPELHLDVHVFATQSTERFVFINMRKYHEGAKMQEGPTVERIRRDGVILDYDGLRFLLPRE